MVEICLTYLLQFDKPNPLTVQTIQEFPLARYATTFWTHHARRARENGDILRRLIMRLFWTDIHCYTNCVRLFNLDVPWNQNLDTTRYLTNVISPLYYTSLTGFTTSVRLLLEAGADVNVQGRGLFGTTL